MIIHHANSVSDHAARRHYECNACGFRVATEVRLMVCPKCGTALTSLAVQRE